MINFRVRPQPAVILLVLAAAGIQALAQSELADRIRESATVLNEIMGAPDSGVPDTTLDAAEAIAIFPSTVKAGFIFAGQRGKGIISVRHRDRREWSLPAFLTLTGGSFGAQIGAQSTDIVLLVMNRRGLEHLLQNQFKIGGDASIAAGPVGRSAEAATDIQLRAEILSYSRSRGLFAGVSLKGSAIRADRDANRDFYGHSFHTREIVLDGKASKPQSPEAVAQWRSTAAKYAPPR